MTIETLRLFSKLVQLIHSDPEDQDALQQFLQAVPEYISCANATLVGRPTQPGDLNFVLSGASSESTTRAFQQDLFRIDPFVNLPANETRTITDYITTADWQQHPFFKSIMSPSGLLHVMGTDIHHGNEVLSLRFTRSTDAPDFTLQDRQRCDLLIPHFQQALAKQKLLRAERSQNQIYDDATSQLAVATLLLDEQQNLVRSNSYAEALIKQTPGIRISGNQLQLQDSKSQSLLQSMLTTLGTEPNDQVLPRALLLNEYSEHAMTLVAKRLQRTNTEPAFAIFISKPHKRLDFSQQHLADMFSLTPAEAKLAALIANGLSLDEAAAELQISRYTAKAQLRAIFSKTGVGQQSHLVHLLLKSISSIA
jgi:DNA-binding CsgD family transcriptional regulator